MTTLLRSILTLVPFSFASSASPSLPRRRLSDADADDEDEDLKTLLNPATCSQKGKHWVWADESGDTDMDERRGHEIYYELHGTGKEHVLFIMGLSNGSSSWSNQVDHFGSLSDYSVLVFDNRGSGHSGYPSGPYTTSAMAKDVISLLDFVEWTGSKSIHLVGISMGGMISLELATLIPERLASLTLCVTSAGDKYRRNFPPREGLQTMAKLMFIIKKQEDRISAAVELLYPATWLDEEDPDDPERRTRRINRIEDYTRRYNNTKPQTPIGNMFQTAACLTHYVSPEKLEEIDRSVGKIVILTGDDDKLIWPGRSRALKDHMNRAELLTWENTGHAIHAQHPKRFNDLLKRTFNEGREISGPPGERLQSSHVGMGVKLDGPAV